MNDVLVKHSKLSSGVRPALRRLVDAVADSLRADHILVEAFPLSDSCWSDRFGTGWDAHTQAELGRLLEDVRRWLDPAELRDVSLQYTSAHCRVYVVGGGLLEKYGVGRVLIALGRCGAGGLSVLVGCHGIVFEDAAAPVLGALLDAFDAGTQLPQHCNAEFERRLAQRTAELMEANAQLEAVRREHLGDKRALSESEKRYACLVENTLTGIFMLEGDRLIFCNTRFAEIFGYDMDEIQSVDLSRLFVKFDERWVDVLWLDNKKAEEGSIVMQGRARDASNRWLLAELTSGVCSGEPIVVGNVVDITDQKNAEDALRASRYELQVLSKQLLLAQETEKKRIAYELHDGIGQNISAIKYEVEHLLQRAEDRDEQQWLEKLAVIREKLAGAIEEVRHISMNLRPSILDELGLVAALSWFCREYQRCFPKCRIRQQIDVQEDRVPEVLKVVIFRIVQEAMNNSGKHAKASAVCIELTNLNNALALRVEDNGQGFSPEASGFEPGIGLRSIRERAKLSGGKLTIGSVPGAGTVVEAVWRLYSSKP